MEGQSTDRNASTKKQKGVTDLPRYNYILSWQVLSRYSRGEPNHYAN